MEQKPLQVFPGNLTVIRPYIYLVFSTVSQLFKNLLIVKVN